MSDLFLYLFYFPYVFKVILLGGFINVSLLDCYTACTEDSAEKLRLLPAWSWLKDTNSDIFPGGRQFFSKRNKRTDPASRLIGV